MAESPQDDHTPSQLEIARRNARFTYAERRIQRIVDGWPPLTEDQRTRLALLLNPGAAAGA